jgi:hypothetical protein
LLLCPHKGTALDKFYIISTMSKIATMATVASGIEGAHKAEVTEGLENEHMWIQTSDYDMLKGLQGKFGSPLHVYSEQILEVIEITPTLNCIQRTHAEASESCSCIPEPVWADCPICHESLSQRCYSPLVSCLGCLLRLLLWI